MQAERDELVKVIFPQIRKLCEQRGGTLVDVDFRWGITDEQKAKGQVLPICLDEIDRCRPFSSVFWVNDMVGSMAIYQRILSNKMSG